MPAHNAERYITAALESVQAQTLRNFEAIIVNDGSIDRTGEIADSYASRDSRFRVLHQANAGVAAARNAAVATASADWLAFLDADDVAVSDRFERQLAFLNDNPDIAALGGTVRLIDTEGRPGAVRRYPTQPGRIAWTMFWCNPCVNSTMMLRRDIWNSIGGARYAIGGDDYGVFMRYALASRVANLRDVLTHYRVSPTNLTATRFEEIEATADGVVCDAVTEITSGRLTIPPTVARMMRNLGIPRYLPTPDQIRRIADLINELVSCIITRMARTVTDARAISQEASCRLWHLSALALRRGDARLALRLSGDAVRMNPAGAPLFGLRAARWAVAVR